MALTPQLLKAIKLLELNNIDLDKSQTLFTLVNNTLINGNQSMGEVYNDHKNDDGFLYMEYSSENTFG